jgi:hypothetical protein
MCVCERLLCWEAKTNKRPHNLQPHNVHFFILIHASPLIKYSTLPPSWVGYNFMERKLASTRHYNSVICEVVSMYTTLTRFNQIVSIKIVAINSNDNYLSLLVRYILSIADSQPLFRTSKSHK